eukprot:65626-Amphidinium_carterae.1
MDVKCLTVDSNKYLFPSLHPAHFCRRSSAPSTSCSPSSEPSAPPVSGAAPIATTGFSHTTSDSGCTRDVEGVHRLPLYRSHETHCLHKPACLKHRPPSYAHLCAA